MLVGITLLCVLSSVLADKPVQKQNNDVNKSYQFYRNKQEIKFNRPIHKFYHTDRQQRVLPQKSAQAYYRQANQAQNKHSQRPLVNPHGRSLPNPTVNVHQKNQKYSAKQRPVKPAQKARSLQPSGRPNSKAYAQHRLRKHQQRVYSSSPSQRVVNKRPRKIQQTPLKLSKTPQKSESGKLKNDITKLTKDTEDDSKADESNQVEVKVKPTKKPVVKKKTTPAKSAKPTVVTKKPVNPVIENRDYKASKPTYKASKPTYKASKPTYKASKPTYKASKPSYKAPSKPKYIIKQAGRKRIKKKLHFISKL